MVRRLLNLDSRIYVAFAGFLLGLVSIKSYGTAVIRHVLLICSLTVCLDSFFIFLKERTWVFSLSGLVSGMIISCVLAPQGAFFIAPLAAILSKHLLRVSGRHIFNPAGFGLLIANVFFRQPLTWWLTTNLLIIISFGLFINYKIGKLSVVASFIVSMLILSIIYSVFKGQHLLANFNLINAFFVFFMLIEPKTSPLYTKGKLIYGALGALFIIISLFIIPRYDFLITGLMSGNIANLFLRKAR